jgi:hypothetical protein
VKSELRAILGQFGVGIGPVWASLVLEPNVAGKI